MAKERDEKHHPNKDKKLLVGVIGNFSTELKLIFMALLLIFTLATLLPLIPSSSFSLSASDFRFCISRFSPAVPVNITSTSTSVNAIPENTTEQKLSDNAVNKRSHDRVLDNGVIKRTFNGHGSASYNFVLMSGYRGGVNSFAVIGLSSKPLHVYGHPSYLCEWVPLDTTQQRPVTTPGLKILTDWGYGRIYTTVVINCTFPTLSAVNSGGNLILHAATGDPSLNLTDSIPVLTEPPNSVDFTLYTSPEKKKYDYLYCGSSLYGDLSPQRVREWIAYHARFFGARSHFVLHDAGGIHKEVFEVLRPWIELGRVTVHDIRDQERFDGYYHNQFMVVNDCLHRYRFEAKWMFFFDVDEFMYVPEGETVAGVMESLEGYSQFTIEQMPMSSRICYSGDGPARTYRKWGFEKMAYRDVKKVPRRDRKYAVQPQNVFATGVHMSQNLQGKTYHKAESKIRYFHYHGSISQRREPCRRLFNDSKVVFENNPYVLDTTIRDIGLAVKTFEMRTIGDRLLRTRQ